MKENVRNLSQKLEEKQENMRVDSVNLKKTEFVTSDFNGLKTYKLKT